MRWLTRLPTVLASTASFSPRTAWGASARAQADISDGSTSCARTRLVLTLAILLGCLGGGSQAAAQVFGPQAILNTNAATDSGVDRSPQVTTDGNGNWVAVWESNDTLGGTIETDLDILVSRSTDAGATWTPPTALNTNAATDSGSDLSPEVTTDGAGNWVAVWESNDTLGGTIETDHDILYSPSPPFPVPGVPALGPLGAGVLALLMAAAASRVARRRV